MRPKVDFPMGLIIVGNIWVYKRTIWRKEIAVVKLRHELKVGIDGERQMWGSLIQATNVEFIDDEAWY